MVLAENTDVTSETGAASGCAPASRRRRGDARVLPDAVEPQLDLRFHGIPSLDDRLVEAVVEPDWRERGALLGTLVDDDDDDGGERVVALASYVRLRNPRHAEAAFAVADEQQGRGIGTRLLEQLAERAAAVGIERFVSYVMADNRAMLGVFEAAGFQLCRKLEGGEVEVMFPIAATESYEAHVAARDHEAVVASLRPFFEPNTVAVVGASKRRGSIGGELFRNIVAGDFRGAAYPVNRGGDPVAGVRGYRSIAEIPDPIDLVVVTLPAAAVLEAASESLREGVRALLVISAGFAEIGRRVSSGRSGSSRSSAHTARGSSGRTASVSPSPARA